MKNDFWLLMISIANIALIVILAMITIRKDIENYHQYESKEILKLKFLIQDIKEKNNNTCVEKYYEIENTLNKIKVKLRI